VIGYISAEEKVDKDFHRALLKVSLHSMWNKMRRRSGQEHLVAFEKAKGALENWSQACLPGIRPVEVEKITGSVGRYKDFDGDFLPRKKSMCQRWNRVDRAYHQGVELPAVSLYKIGDAYFVRDGNHRVSVARYHEAAAIDAEVVEISGQMRPDPAQRGGRTKDARAYLAQPAPRKGCWKGTWSARLFAFVRRERGVIGPKPAEAST
jgi:hypothetical protein